MKYTTPLKETDLLRPKSPSLSDKNWPEFTLSNVEVYDPADDDALSNLFEADASNQLELVGRLDALERSQNSLVINKRKFPVVLRISKVETFAYGQKDDGSSEIWAAGQAGWYLIRPSRSYKDIFRDMQEATNLLYFATDYYLAKEDRKTPEKRPVRDLFREFCRDPSNDCDQLHAAERRFIKHRKFLLHIMSKPPKRNDVRWKKGALYEFLTKSDAAEQANGHDPDNDPMDQDSSDTGVADDIANDRTKSSLRPRNGQFSLKAAGRRHVAADSSPTPNQTTTANSVASKKDGSKGRGARSSKRTRYKYQIDGDEEEVTFGSAGDDYMDDAVLAQLFPFGAGLPAVDDADRMTKLEVVEEPLPTFDATGPGDTWNCPFDGCAHVIYAASTSKSKDFIGEHYQRHAVESQSKIEGLVYQEERPYLPISNLLKKVRQVTASRSVGNNGLITRTKSLSHDQPRPIERKY